MRYRKECMHINAFMSGNLKENGCHLIDLIFQSLFDADDDPIISRNYSNDKNVSFSFKNKNHNFNTNLTHISSKIDLFEIQIFFPFHILILEFGGAASI